MALSVRIDGGRMTAAIADSRGRAVDYEVDPAARPPALWAAEVRRAGAARAYRVALWPGGGWSCDCPHSKYRGAFCKHKAAALEIAAATGVEMAKEQAQKRAAQESLTPARAIAKRLADPFPAAVVKWKPQVVKGNKAMAIAYIDARIVMDRLDEVLGVDRWQDEYRTQPDGSVVCRLSCNIAGEWLVKEDVGSQSAQKDEHDRDKAAFSDALKRAAVKWGVGRYLYRLGATWVDYDPQRQRIVRAPALPAWALPDPHLEQSIFPDEEQAEPEPEAAASPVTPVTPCGALWATAKEFDAALADKGTCAAGELLEHLRQTVGASVKAPPEAWDGDEVKALMGAATERFLKLKKLERAKSAMSQARPA